MHLRNSRQPAMKPEQARTSLLHAAAWTEMVCDTRCWRSVGKFRKISELVRLLSESVRKRSPRIYPFVSARGPYAWVPSLKRLQFPAQFKQGHASPELAHNPHAHAAPCKKFWRVLPPAMATLRRVHGFLYMGKEDPKP